MNFEDKYGSKENKTFYQKEKRESTKSQRKAIAWNVARAANVGGRMVRELVGEGWRDQFLKDFMCLTKGVGLCLSESTGEQLKSFKQGNDTICIFGRSF